ncbi:MAG: hypothetical protein ACUZ8N_06105 [Candidatus Scalindua sp.]
MSYKRKLTKDFEIERLKPIIEKYNLSNIENSESPDFVTKLNGASLGIEIVSLLNPSIESNEQLEFRICNEAEKKYNECKLPPVSVILAFTGEFDLKTPDFKKTIKALIDCTKNHCGNEYSYDFLCNDDYPVDRILYRTFEAIHIKRVSGSKSKWTPENVDIQEIQSVSEANIQDVINNKDRKIVNYKKRCNFIWLIIDIGNYSPSTRASLEGNILSHIYKSKFTKTILLYGNEVSELITE